MFLTLFILRMLDSVYNYYDLYYYYYLLNVYVCALLVLYYICTEWHVHLRTYVYVCGILFNI